MENLKGGSHTMGNERHCQLNGKTVQTLIALDLLAKLYLRLVYIKIKTLKSKVLPPYIMKKNPKLYIITCKVEP